MGWVIMSPGREIELVSSLYTRTSVSDFDRLCDVDVLEVNHLSHHENHLSHHENVYKKFKQQLERNEEGWYGKGLVWTENKVPLNNNKSGSLGCLKSLLKRLEQNPELFKAYDQIITEQLVNNMIEKVSENQSENSKEFFLPHRPAESTKLIVIYAASAKSESGYSLNDCLEKGPSLQKKLWDILIRTKFRPVILCADIEKLFLQIRIKEKERESP